MASLVSGAVFLFLFASDLNIWLQNRFGASIELDKECGSDVSYKC